MKTKRAELEKKTPRGWLGFFALPLWVALGAGCSIYGLVMDNTMLIFGGLVVLLAIANILLYRKIDKVEKRLDNPRKQ